MPRTININVPQAWFREIIAAMDTASSNFYKGYEWMFKAYSETSVSDANLQKTKVALEVAGAHFRKADDALRAVIQKHQNHSSELDSRLWKPLLIIHGSTVGIGDGLIEIAKRTPERLLASRVQADIPKFQRRITKAANGSERLVLLWKRWSVGAKSAKGMSPRLAQTMKAARQVGVRESASRVIGALRGTGYDANPLDALHVYASLNNRRVSINEISRALDQAGVGRYFTNLQPYRNGVLITLASV